MHAPECATQPEQVIKVVELRCMTSPAGKSGNQKALRLLQCRAVNFHRRNNGQTVINQFLSEGMLFQNLLAGPAPRPVELDDDRVGFFDAYLIDAILITVKGEQAQVTAQANGLDAVDHAIRCQPLKGMGHGSPRDESAYVTPRRKGPECAPGTTRPPSALRLPRTRALLRLPLHQSS